MFKYDAMLENMLADIGIKINGGSPWDIKINDNRTYEQVLRNKNLGLGEAYMEGWWDCRQLDEFICRILKAGLDTQVKGRQLLRLKSLWALIFNLQSRLRSRMVAEQHYNLDNELFTAMLDPYVQYSCAYFDKTDLQKAEHQQRG